MTGEEFKVKMMMAIDPDLNLYLLAFERPDLEDAALKIASEAVGDEAHQMQLLYERHHDERLR